MTDLPTFERSPILPNVEEDKEIWQTRWHCFCCQDTGQIQAHLVSLIIPDYDHNRDRIPVCQGCNKFDNYHLKEYGVLDLRFDLYICKKTEPQPEAVQKPKGRQRKGCLYKYLENKKLKNGSIVSYPRVIGHRQADNPTHWRWGFNWEEKVDGEWKGRSFGCVPVGAIALIQSMQNEGVSLEEIIGFIRRAKAKK